MWSWPVVDASIDVFRFDIDGYSFTSQCEWRKGIFVADGEMSLCAAALRERVCRVYLHVRRLCLQCVIHALLHFSMIFDFLGNLLLIVMNSASDQDPPQPSSHSCGASFPTFPRPQESGRAVARRPRGLSLSVLRGVRGGVRADPRQRPAGAAAVGPAGPRPHLPARRPTVRRCPRAHVHLRCWRCGARVDDSEQLFFAMLRMDLILDFQPCSRCCCCRTKWLWKAQWLKKESRR